MFRRSGKNKNQEENTPINTNIAGVIHNAMMIQRAHQTTMVGHVDPAKLQGQTPGNPIMAGPSSPADPTSSAQARPDQAGGRSRISSSISIGQDQAFDEVCKFLTEDDVWIVGIYGMGGVGKTTLTKKVWYEFLEPSNFKVLPIVVSKILNVDRIQEDIMDEMDLPFKKDAHPHKRARDINKAIANSSRKLALLFDDIWEVLDLYEIGVLGGMSLDTSMFKIIFTTRLEDVCSHMQSDRELKVQPLGWDDSWALFAKHVGTKTLDHSHHEILDLAKGVAKECGGLPLALIVIGRAMTCKYNRGAWEDALYNLRKSPAKVQGSEERLFSILKLSYDNIQDDVEKECFLFCCLYPEDWKINREELVEFWIGDGILVLDGSYHDACNKGYAIIDRLSAACLVELNKGGSLTMHDIIRDMGLWITSESKFFVHGERLKLTKDQINNRWEEAHGMYVLEGDDLPEQPHCRNLSTLIFDMRRPMRLGLQNSFLQFMHKLRILKMHNVEFLDTSCEIIGQSVELRWLSIHYTNLKKFPSELGNLRKLNVLLITFSREHPASLPPAMGELSELRKLRMDGPTSITMLPSELRKLSKLEELVLPSGTDYSSIPSFMTGSVKCTMYKDGFINLIPNGIFEHMRELRRLELSVTSVSILPADLWNLSKLEHLAIESFGLLAEHDSEDMDHREFSFGMAEYPPWLNLDNVGLSIEGLKQLSKSLRILELRRWPIFKWDDIGSALGALNEMSELSIVEFPLNEIIVTSKSASLPRLEKLSITQCPQLVKLQAGGDALKCLRSLTIYFCASLKHTIGIDHLEHLKSLTICYCPELEGELMNPNEGISSLPLCFPNLETLGLYYLPQVTAICSDNVSFPSLSRLDISGCQKLGKFSKGLMNEKRPLQGEIKGTKEWWEGLQWQDGDFKSYLLPFFENLSE